MELYATKIIDLFLFNANPSYNLSSYKKSNSFNDNINKNRRWYSNSNDKEYSSDVLINFRIKEIIKIIENKCSIYKRISRFSEDDALTLKFLLEHFAIQFVK